MKNSIVGIVVGAVILSGASFFAGTKYASNASTNPTGTQRTFNASGRTGGRLGANGNGFIAGKILSKDSTSITVELGGFGSTTPNQASGSKIILFSGSTQIGKMTAGSPDDLIVGEMINVNGTTNSDGSVTAQTIQIRPVGIGGRTN